VQTLPGHITGPSLAVVPYQTVIGFCRHLFSYDPYWNPTPLWVAPWLATVLPAGLLLVLLGVSSYRAPRDSRDSMAFAAFTTLSVILSPLSLDYHYTLMLLPLALAASALTRARLTWRSACWLTIAAMLIALPLPYLDRRLEVGALALLAYPKLYGALLLWGFLIAHRADSGDAHP
jgi:hypothetical protein